MASRKLNLIRAVQTEPQKGVRGDSVSLHFSRPPTQLEFDGIVARIQQALK